MATPIQQGPLCTHAQGRKKMTPVQYRISMQHPDQWLDHLQTHGFVVVTNVLQPDQVSKAKSGVWDWLESLGSGIQRTNPSTWTNVNWPGALRMGFLQSHGGGQSTAAWYVRSLDCIKACFAHIWKTDQLLVSMDTFICWRPWWLHDRVDTPLEECWKPSVEGIHCDQNATKRPGFHCVQGMCVLVDVDARIGGLQVVPHTHTDRMQAYLRQRYDTSGMDDWCPLHEQDKYGSRGIPLQAFAGDLILWDSRTLHGGLVRQGPDPGTIPGQGHSVDFARLALTVCMTPKSKASTRVLSQRPLAVDRGLTLTHWPHDFVCHGGEDTDGRHISHTYTPPILSKEQLDLFA